MRQNITLSLDKEVLRKAKVLAAQQGTSLSGLLTQYLERMVQDEDLYDAARRKALSLLARGFHLGGKIPVSREEWHAR